MNPYQKAAALVIRMVGSVLALVGLVGPLYVSVLMLLGKAPPPYPKERWWGSAAWLLGGTVLVLSAKALGRRFGRGLE